MYIKRKVGGQKQAGPPCHWLMVVVPFVVGAVGWWWWWWFGPLIAIG